MAKVVYQMA